MRSIWQSLTSYKNLHYEDLPEAPLGWFNATHRRTACDSRSNVCQVNSYKSHFQQYLCTSARIPKNWPKAKVAPCCRSIASDDQIPSPAAFWSLKASCMSLKILVTTWYQYYRSLLRPSYREGGKLDERLASQHPVRKSILCRYQIVRCSEKTKRNGATIWSNKWSRFCWSHRNMYI